MKVPAWIVDVAVGLALAAATLLVLLFSSFNSTFIYRGF
jgi:hypothetical protein